MNNTDNTGDIGGDIRNPVVAILEKITYAAPQRNIFLLFAWVVKQIILNKRWESAHVIYVVSKIYQLGIKT